MTDSMRGAREEASEMAPRVSSPEPLELRSSCRNGTHPSACNQGSGRDMPTAGTARRGQEGLASELLKSSLLLGGREQDSSEGRLVVTNGGTQRKCLVGSSGSRLTVWL